MSKAYVTEYSKIMTNREAVVPVPVTPITAAQVVNFTATHGESSAFNDATRFISVVADADCSIAFGSAPVATTSNDRQIAGERTWFAVTPGQKISVVAN